MMRGMYIFNPALASKGGKTINGWMDGWMDQADVVPELKKFGLAINSLTTFALQLRVRSGFVELIHASDSRAHGLVDPPSAHRRGGEAQTTSVTVCMYC